MLDLISNDRKTNKGFNGTYSFIDACKNDFRQRHFMQPEWNSLHLVFGLSVTLFLTGLLSFCLLHKTLFQVGRTVCTVGNRAFSTHGALSNYTKVNDVVIETITLILKFDFLASLSPGAFIFRKNIFFTLHFCRLHLTRSYGDWRSKCILSSCTDCVDVITLTYLKVIFGKHRKL